MKAVQSIWLAANRGSPTSAARTQFPVPVADPIFRDGTSTEEVGQNRRP